jgi:hypothetical protein
VPLNGGKNNSVWWFDNYPANFHSDNVVALALPNGRDKGNDAYVLQLLKNTNPLRSEFSVPVAIRELVDLTTLFSLAAKTFAGFAGGAYLNYNFGWLAFERDLKTLSGIVERVLSRVRELDSLSRGGGLRRRLQLDKFGVMQVGNRVINSTHSVFLEARYNKSTVREVWGSVRWYPKSGYVLPQPADRWTYAARQVFDLEKIDAETLWNILPWSWLVDYFTNIGDLLAAYEGSDELRPTDICIMRRTVTIDNGQRRSLGDLSDRIRGGSYRLRREVLERKVISNPPTNITAFRSLLTMSEYLVVLALLAKFRG